MEGRAGDAIRLRRHYYYSGSLGLSHQVNDVVMIRPEVGYYRNFNRGAFDLGTEKAMTMVGVDMTLRF